MYFVFIISIISTSFYIISGSYLEAEPTYQKPQIERNNKVNKGVWVKNKRTSGYDRGDNGEFIFRANSYDADSFVGNEYNGFSQDDIHNAFIPNYRERTKRSAAHTTKQLRKSLITCKRNKECQKEVLSKFKSKLKHLIPYADESNSELLSKNNKRDINNITNNTETVIDYKTSGNDSLVHNLKPEIAELKNTNTSEMDTAISKKRSMNSDQEAKTLNKFDLNNGFNNISEASNNDDVKPIEERNIFNKNFDVWHQNAPIPESIYKVVPKTSKPPSVNEKGLLKVLAVLTKTFRKIAKQHDDIKRVHKKIQEFNEDFNKNIDFVTNKFHVFDAKYSYLLDLIEKIKVLENKINTREEVLINKETDLAKNLIDFENQQRKFLAQQRQFYNVQKTMLNQNEKINLKQNLISKTQSEIAQKQSNFARVLKKAKQVYIENKQNKTYNTAKTNQSNIKTTNKTYETKTYRNKIKTKQMTSTENVKINLLSVAPLSQPVSHLNKDEMILREKDDQTVDELIYKYYFNNTFLDHFMKNKILPNLPKTDITKKIKRHGTQPISNTVLYPVNKIEYTRSKRWINHHSKRKSFRKNRGKQQDKYIDAIDDKKPFMKNHPNEIGSTQNHNFVPIKDDNAKNVSDPFKAMAIKFCNEIRQNTNEQIMSWCIEKALRKLQNINLPLPDKQLNNSLSNKEFKQSTELRPQNFTQDNVKQVSNKPEESVHSSTNIIPTQEPDDGSNNGYESYFPDNDDLEAKLNEFDIKPDKEGNVYYDGSLHTSDIVIGESDGGLSDLMPGLDSSRADLDPYTFDFQGRRQALIKRINDNMMKSTGTNRYRIKA